MLRSRFLFILKMKKNSTLMTLMICSDIGTLKRLSGKGRGALWNFKLFRGVKQQLGTSFVKNRQNFQQDIVAIHILLVSITISSRYITFIFWIIHLACSLDFIPHPKSLEMDGKRCFLNIV